MSSNGHDYGTCESEDGRCKGGFEILMVYVAFSLILAVSLILGWWYCYCIKKQDREPRQFMERQEQV